MLRQRETFDLLRSQDLFSVTKWGLAFSSGFAKMIESRS